MIKPCLEAGEVNSIAGLATKLLESWELRYVGKGSALKVKRKQILDSGFLIDLLKVELLYTQRSKIQSQRFIQILIEG